MPTQEYPAYSGPSHPAGTTGIPITRAERDEILSVFLGLHEEDFLRRNAPPPFGDRIPVNADTPQIIERLWVSETRWRERAFAAWTLGQMDLAPSERSTAANALAHLITNRMRTSGTSLGSRALRALQRTAMLTTAGFTAVLLLFLFGCFVTSPLIDAEQLFWMFLSVPLAILGGLACSVYVLPVVLPLSLALDAARNNFVRATAVTALGRLRVPERVGVLAHALADGNGRVRDAAEAALYAVLPLLTTEHYGRLPADTVPGLCKALGHLYHITPFAGSVEGTRREQLLVLLIEALGKVGDGRAAPLMEWLAGESMLPRVQSAAVAVLPVLRERQRQESDRDALLRAVSAPVATSQELLRPVTGCTGGDPQQLLRPGQAVVEPAGTLDPVIKKVQ
ncbi:MAG: hypothetical protein RMJ43_07950 [Chloroherpetonaceae bacterium]|nr:hypothetical protein [Chthonomonadaceae bacterium]MDW8207755.1 hypothetical protein [Chloroherpetonaceae bacterium]